MKVFVIDIARCNGCYNCQIACKDEHAGNDWLPYAKAQPEAGQFWLKLEEFVKGTVPKVTMHYQPVLCAHCDGAPCMKACTVEGAIYKREDGLVIIDPAKCNGCKACVSACPSHVIYFNDEYNIAQKCTGCAHLLDNGWEVPRCVDACPTECLKFGEASEFREMIQQAEPACSGTEGEPRLYYMNTPGKFITGTVYDPVAGEVVSGATCRLSDEGNGSEIITGTDGFGDFWFKDLEENYFSLKIENDGKSVQVTSIDTKQDVNLGDIALE
ncbi:MAG: 4Fe-4S dicluster domain-containing protein [Dehalococcoidales bacterium]|nr:4Fe-4S dicluster domain-containing protein [Dehalococcoidales bacterium]